MRYEVWVSWLNDIFPFDTELAALRYANEINKQFYFLASNPDAHGYDHAPLTVAIVREKK